MIRVAVIDDSATMRALITTLLRREDDIEIVGIAGTIAEARNLIRATNPDVVTLDLEMPDMHGLDFLTRLMRLRPLPVIVVSGDSDLSVTSEAMRLGAVAYYLKCADGKLLETDRGRLAGLVRQAAGKNSAPAHPGLIAIGASTGGINALDAVLSQFPADCPPTVIVQHTSERYVASLAQQLDARHRPRVLPADDGQRLQRGSVMLAASNQSHLVVVAGPHGLQARLRNTPPAAGHRPSVDVLFQSVADAVPGGAVGVLLSGMGCDGARGLLAMRQAGCPTIAQDEATATVFGMPRAAAEVGAAQFVLPLDRIARQALLACAA